MKKIVLALVLVLALGACRTTPPLDAGETFRFDVSCRGTAGERTVVLDVTPDSMPLGREVPLDDVTTVDDSLNAIHRIHMSPLRPQSGGRHAAPSTGHIEFNAMAARPLELVIDYKGHRDVYHLSFPQRGGVAVDPAQGEFSRIFMR